MASEAITIVGGIVEIQLGQNTSNLALACRGTFAGYNCAFEGQVEDGGTWFPTDAVRSTGATVETATGVLSAAPAYSWDVSVGGYKRFRIRCTARSTGSQIWDSQPYAGGPECAPVAVVSSIAAALPAGANAIGDMGIQARANATGAGSAAKVNAAAGTNGTVVKASAGRLLGFCLANHAATARYVKLHNSTTVTPGTTPVAYLIGIPPGQFAELSIPAGIGHTTGICYSITGAAADNDATAVVAGDVTGHLVFS